MTLRALVVALLVPCASLAQSRVTVPVQDPVYRDIDRLIALRLVEVGLYGQRPYSRREIARLTREAKSSISTREVSASTRRIVERMAGLYAADVRQLDKTEPVPRSFLIAPMVEGVLLSSPARGIPTDDLGSVVAGINPLLDGRSGRELFDRKNLAIEYVAELHGGERLALRFHPRVVPYGRDEGMHSRLQGLSVTAPIRNVTIEVGRQPIVWGQGMEGGLLFSSSGKPLDMLRVSTDLPFRGWFIKGTSPMRGSIVVADLGPRQHFPNSYLIAYKLSGHPFTNRVELAASVLGVQGGRGAPKGSFRDHVQDLIPPLKYLFPDNTTQFSNKMAGWEYRLRLPELRGLQLYAEHAFEDMDPRRWGSTFWEDGGHIFGASLSDLGAEGAFSATTEFHHTGLRFYKHGVFLSGMTFDGTLFGDPLGNQADAGYLRLHWDRGRKARITLDAALERRDGDYYRALSDGPDEDNFRFEMLQSVPAEWRQRLTATYRSKWDRDDVVFSAGLERVRDAGFVRGERRTNFIVGARLESSFLIRTSQRPKTAPIPSARRCVMPNRSSLWRVYTAHNPTSRGTFGITAG